MALILSIETATTVCSVAVHKNGEVLGNQTLFIAHSHSGLLAPTIDSLLNYVGFEPASLDAIAISKGPGSYTGLRIGTSTAKGLCHALDIPLIAVNTLKGMALSVAKYVERKKNTLLCPMIDARRMEVYHLLADVELNILEPTQPKIIEESSFDSLLKDNKIYFFGNGADKCKKVIEHENAKFIDDITPDATIFG
ncbi:MAG: tRNA (adenosine(37)-N6)-threonylcarbamoyltransferase complex dimerization subunit type 1 TsaB [Fulvivirga sp.]|nr:tRNA (adenosine(37)-N6)-threonylcarbamoyltransferase complex dimerization subunit type 1 TsaB [Fulvivirga sp.]